MTGGLGGAEEGGRKERPGEEEDETATTPLGAFWRSEEEVLLGFGRAGAEGESEDSGARGAATAGPRGEW